MDGAVLTFCSTPRGRVRGAAAPVCLLFALGAVLISSSCGGKGAASAEIHDLKIGARGTDEAPGVIRSMLFAEGLVAIDAHGKPTPRLASSWEWEQKDKGLTLRVHLRQGVRFHDDTPVTAEVVARILRAKKEKADGFEAVKSIEASDPQTVLFHLTRPDGFLPSALANTTIVDDKKPDIGTGPFRLVAQSPLAAERNRSYYRGTPGFERITVNWYPTPRAAWAGLMKGEVDLAMEINKESVEFLEGATQFKTYPSIQPYYIPLVFNLVTQFWRVRKCVAQFLTRSIARKSWRRACGEDRWLMTPSGPCTGPTSPAPAQQADGMHRARARPACDSMGPDFRFGPPHRVNGQAGFSSSVCSSMATPSSSGSRCCSSGSLPPSASTSYPKDSRSTTSFHAFRKANSIRTCFS
jgi:hypothetical protein